MSVGGLVLWSVVGYLVGTLLHEGTHYVLALVFGLRPSAHVSVRRRVYVEHDSIGVLRDGVVHLAPFVLGMAAILLWVLSPVVEITFPVVVGWFSYTIMGLPTDFNFLGEVDPRAFAGR